MEQNRRKSRQRDRILELVQEGGEHPTAQMIYEKLKLEISRLSLGNVYRNLRILIEQGVLKSRDFGDGIERFDAITGPHYHFICERCGSVSDFFMPLQDSVTESAQKISGHTITGHTIQFTGICEKCKKRRRG